MRSPSLSDLPPPPPGKTGWPWTEECPQLPDLRADGTLWPRISIVTPSYNQGEFIEETIRSILLQGYPDIEYHILDGASTDDSAVIIRKYEAWLASWRSEKDGGQAAAINTALELATGVWFQNINSDDVLNPFALARVGEAPMRAAFLYGDVLEFSEHHLHLVRNTPPSVRDLIRPIYRSPAAAWHQPGVFLKREHMLALGGYDPSFGYVFDLVLMARYVERFPEGQRISATLVKFRIHLNAKSSAWQERYIAESIRARQELSRRLVVPRNRRLALREASRRLMMLGISGADSEMLPSRNASDVITIVRGNPMLALDRMFLGALRRRPLYWLKAAAS